jgi:hypothetical protein
VDARTGAEAGAVVFLALAGGRIGAIPGSLPVLAGWAATGMPIDVVALALTGVLFMWQIPHFLAIGWMARDDYATAGCPMLSVVETTERASARISLTYAAGIGLIAPEALARMRAEDRVEGLVRSPSDDRPPGRAGSLPGVARLQALFHQDRSAREDQ